MENWLPRTPSEFVLLYATVIAVVAYFLFRRRPRRGMLLRLRGSRSRDIAPGDQHSTLAGATPPVAQKFSHIRPLGERPLNVVFNYNGHSWDAYEVLGLPAGSSPERVREAYAKALETVSDDSRGILEAAHRAIYEQWDGFKKTNHG